MADKIVPPYGGRQTMLVRNELNTFLLPDFRNEDVMTARLEGEAGELWLFSA